MAFALRELDHLVLEGGAVARADAGDGAGVEGREVKVFADHPLRLRPGVAEVTDHPVAYPPPGEEGEGLGRLVAGLGKEAAPVDGVSVQAHGGARLEAGHLQAQGFEAFGQFARRGLVGPAGRIGGGADENAAAQEGARGYDHRVGRDLVILQQAHAAAAAIRFQQGGDDALAEPQAGRGLEQALHVQVVERFVVLAARGAYGRPLGAVEELEVDAGGVGGAGHDPAQGVDLLHQVTLGDAADGRVAGHLGHGLQVHGQQQGVGAQARRGAGRLDAGMPRPHHHHPHATCRCRSG